MIRNNWWKEEFIHITRTAKFEATCSFRRGLNLGSHCMRALIFVPTKTQNTAMILPSQGKRNWTSETGSFLLLTKRSFSPFPDYTNKRTKEDLSTGKECFNPCSRQRETNYSALISERRSSPRITWPHARMYQKGDFQSKKENFWTLWLFRFTC